MLYPVELRGRELLIITSAWATSSGGFHGDIVMSPAAEQVSGVQP